MLHSEKSVWDIFSKLIETRDTNSLGYCECISCSQTANKKAFDSGHYLAQGNDYALKFNEINNNA